MIKKAMILAAGFGKRINPLTLQTPKPLLKIGNETLLSNTIKFLKLYGVKQAVVNVHYLGEQIVEYISKNKFNLDIKVIREKEKILDTGGGVLNALDYFSNEPFLIINPDTIWNSNYLEGLKSMESLIFKNKKKCFLLVVNKEKSFDKSLKGDFNLKDNLITRENKNNLKYIFTGLQIIMPKAFSKIDEKVFSMNKIWDNLIKTDELYGVESEIDFLHVSTLSIYRSLIEKKLYVK